MRDDGGAKRMLSGFTRILKALWLSGKPSSTSEPPMPLSNDETISPKTSQTNIVLISVIGMENAARDQMLDWMVEDCKASGKIPVFITDDLDLTPWIERQLLIEHLPSLAQQTNLAPDLDWDLYVKRRLSQIKRKWQTGDITDLGGKLGEVDKPGRNQAMAEDDVAAQPIGRRG